MKIWRITLVGKDRGHRHCIYFKAATEREAREHYNKNFSRFNHLVKITDITNTKTGKKHAESL